MQVASLLVAILLAATSLAAAAPVGADLQAGAAPASNAQAAGAQIALTRRGKSQEPASSQRSVFVSHIVNSPHPPTPPSLDSKTQRKREKSRTRVAQFSLSAPGKGGHADSLTLCHNDILEEREVAGAPREHLTPAPKKSCANAEQRFTDPPLLSVDRQGSETPARHLRKGRPAVGPPTPNREGPASGFEAVPGAEPVETVRKQTEPRNTCSFPAFYTCWSSGKAQDSAPADKKLGTVDKHTPCSSETSRSTERGGGEGVVGVVSGGKGGVKEGLASIHGYKHCFDSKRKDG
ncbi:hypothetical protein DFJ73DRAFT_763029 [Zopfochytrium polystomum]|nr:hypothetical protein DFJ73DRAFT_763029 [Zopfochytrium polystomum]